MDRLKVKNGPVELNIVVAGRGPLILCVHGFPELSYSWRWQVEHFSSRGYTVAAVDVRGYGESSKPAEIAAYRMLNLTSDVAAVVDALGGKAILFGHDWGAPIVWNTALLYPGKIAAVAGLSVPYGPRGEASFIEAVKTIYAGRFFYQTYFQTEGVAEAELEADVAATLRKLYYDTSGNAPASALFADKPADATFLQGLVDPSPFPAWLTEADLAVYVDAFKAGGFRGPINRYRAQDIDFFDLADLQGRHIAQPACFIAGEKDPARRFIPGRDLYENPGFACDDFRGRTIIPGIGHWVQQEAPEATNAALSAFLDGL